MSDANGSGDGRDEHSDGRNEPWTGSPDGEGATGPLRADLAAQFEAVAAALRAGDAAVYGYEVRGEPSPPHESGAVSFPGGWVEFRFEER
jgi:hypothetical protein